MTKLLGNLRSNVAMVVLVSASGCGSGLEGLGEVADDDADVATIDPGLDTGLSEVSDSVHDDTDLGPDTATDTGTAPDTRAPPSDTAPPPGDTALPPSDTTPPPTDTAPLFDSTPGIVTCGTVACNWMASPSQCCLSPLSGPVSCTSTGGCPSDHNYQCDEKADCTAYGYGPSSVCCVGVTNNSACVPGVGGGCGPYPQLCMTNTECPSGKCVSSALGPGKASTHGQCAP